jgi:hypothetical protein
MDLDWLTPQRQQALCISDDQTWPIDASATGLHITLATMHSNSPGRNR